MDTTQVLLTMRFTDDLLNQIEAVSPRLRVTQQTCHGEDELAAALRDHPDTEVLYTFFVGPDVQDLAPNLRWVQLHSAGADHLLGQPVMRSDIALTTASGVHATPIAEYVFASMLAYRWRVPNWTICQREAEWPKGRWKEYARPELRGSTLGIVGYGSIGREVGRLAQAFGMRVLALRRGAGREEQGYTLDDRGDPAGDVPTRFFSSEALHDMLAESDYVLIAVPLTADTEHYIGEAELRAMKPSAYLVNIARGPIVDEAALVQALREGWIGGAGLDVFDQEPLPSDSPLWRLEKALISPHIAGFTPHYDQRATDLFVENLRRYLGGDPLLNLVDKERGY